MIGEKCAVYKCTNIAIAKGLCSKHYKRQLRHGHILETRPADWGSREKHPLYRMWCHLNRYQARNDKLAKEWIDDFWAFANEVKTHAGPRKYVLCAKDDSIPIGPDNWYWKGTISYKTPEQKERARELSRKWWAENQEYAMDKMLKRHYGITFDDYVSISNDQNGVCAICKREETSVDYKNKKVRRLAVDHCHKTHKVRGLLCQACNTSLGSFQDNVAILQSAIDYLKKYQT